MLLQYLRLLSCGRSLVYISYHLVLTHIMVNLDSSVLLAPLYLSAVFEVVGCVDDCTYLVYSYHVLSVLFGGVGSINVLVLRSVLKPVLVFNTEFIHGVHLSELLRNIMLFLFFWYDLTCKRVVFDKF